MRLTAVLLLAFTGTVGAATSLDLSNYRVEAAYDLPAIAVEASAVTYNWDTGTLFVVGDGGLNLVEVSLTGSLLSSMPMKNFQDTEAITYLGNGAFLIGEERLENVYRFNYTSGATLNRNNLTAINLGPNAGNDGIEGISYDPLTGNLLAVKEKNPENIFSATINYTNHTASLTNLFDPALLGLADLADLQALSTNPAYLGTELGTHLLILSQASSTLLEVDRAGKIYGSFDFLPYAYNAEGVTIDRSGTIYVVSESPELYVLRPLALPEPSCVPLLAIGLAGLGSRRVRFRAR